MGIPSFFQGQVKGSILQLLMLKHATAGLGLFVLVLRAKRRLGFNWLSWFRLHSVLFGIILPVWKLIFRLN